MSTLPARGTFFKIEEEAQFIPLFDATGCVLGLLTSALFDLPSGASIVLALTGTAIITAEVAGRSPEPLFKALTA